MSAEVTREHRALARDALYFENTVLRVWVETGQSQDAGRANRVAQAIADAEARGAARVAAPPADEVAGLTRDVERLRYTLRIAPIAVEPHRLAKEALDRIENHLKGKR